MQNWTKGSTYTSVALVTIGFALIALGWNGAAATIFVDSQIPYLISGGVGGLALVGGGMSLAVVNARRQDTAALLVKLDEVIEALAASGGAAGGPTAVPEGSDLVVAGRTTYHAPTCRLVEGRSDLQVMAPTIARDRGLAPCRICDPAAQTA